MRLLLAALVVTFVIAVVASVFAIWPAVGDAPWEDELAAPTIMPVVQQTECEKLRELLANAQTDNAAFYFRGDMDRAGCNGRSGDGQLRPGILDRP